VAPRGSDAALELERRWLKERSAVAHRAGGVILVHA